MSFSTDRSNQATFINDILYRRLQELESVFWMDGQTAAAEEQTDVEVHIIGSYLDAYKEVYSHVHRKCSLSESIDYSNQRITLRFVISKY